MKRNQHTAPIAVTLFLILVCGVALELLCARYMYLPLFMLAQILFLLGLATVILGLFARVKPFPAEPAEAVLPTDAAGDGGAEPVKRGAGQAIRAAFAAVGRFFVSLWRSVSTFFRRHVTVIEIVVLAALFAVGQIRFIPSLARFTDAAQIGYGTALALLIGSFVCIVFDKWCLWACTAGAAEEEDGARPVRAILHNLRITLKIARFCSLGCAAIAVLKLIGLWDGQRWLCYGLIVVWAYCSLFYVISLILRTVRREFRTNPRLSIPLPFIGREEDDDMQILSHLENNTGITFRSLWSLKYIKQVLPYTVALTLLFFWLATGLVQVAPYEQAARYRFGRLDADDILGPGMHMTLPWPFDKTEVYDTGHVRELTIGYDADRQSDNLWTEAHGANEYRLLLGEGNELVSVNMRLEYRIDDLWQYITASADPASLLSAEAYELITDRTISTNLDTLLSVDRIALSDELCGALNDALAQNPIGLEVIRVVVENIHPPVEVASIYQGVVSAEISADTIVWTAEAQAAVTLAEAEKTYDSLVKAAEAGYYGQVAAAEAEVTEFMAAVAADNSYRDAYRYYKYLGALQQSLGGSRLYLLGPDVDAASLYLGSSYVIVNGGK